MCRSIANPRAIIGMYSCSVAMWIAPEVDKLYLRTLGVCLGLLSLSVSCPVSRLGGGQLLVASLSLFRGLL